MILQYIPFLESKKCVEKVGHVFGGVLLQQLGQLVLRQKGLQELKLINH